MWGLVRISVSVGKGGFVSGLLWGRGGVCMGVIVGEVVGLNKDLNHYQ